MIEQTTTIKSPTGLESRPATMFISFLKKFSNCKITLISNGKLVNPKDILSLLSLNLLYGSQVTVRVEGSNEMAVVKEIINFIDNLKD